ncbi:hypothetical protein C8R45DRAFT_1104602 [Mycena sanguinolenta]|nr:hypothetical protein C8R45DRAFT_1104602 [Mycena sanguinolenta]
MAPTTRSGAMRSATAEVPQTDSTTAAASNSGTNIKASIWRWPRAAPKPRAKKPPVEQETVYPQPKKTKRAKRKVKKKAVVPGKTDGGENEDQQRVAEVAGGNGDEMEIEEVDMPAVEFQAPEMEEHRPEAEVDANNGEEMEIDEQRPPVQVNEKEDSENEEVEMPPVEFKATTEIDELVEVHDNEDGEMQVDEQRPQVELPEFENRDSAGPPGTDPVARGARRFVAITEEVERRRELPRDEARPPGLLTDKAGRIVPIRTFQVSSHDAGDSSEDEMEGEEHQRADRRGSDEYENSEARIERSIPAGFELLQEDNFNLSRRRNPTRPFQALFHSPAAKTPPVRPSAPSSPMPNDHPPQPLVDSPGVNTPPPRPSSPSSPVPDDPPAPMRSRGTTAIQPNSTEDDDRGLESDVSHSSEDFGQDQAKRQKQREYKLSKGRSVSPVTDDEDKEDEKEFEDLVEQEGLMGEDGRTRAKVGGRKGKAKRATPPAAGTGSKRKRRATPHKIVDSDDEEGSTATMLPKGAKGKTAASKGKSKTRRTDEDEGEEDEEADEYPGYARGPIPSECKAEVQALRTTYETGLEQVALKYNQSLRTLLELTGDVVRLPRDKALWNVYQQWYPHEGRTKKADGDWTKFVRSEFQKKRDELPEDQRNDPDALNAHFAEVWEWHAEATADTLEGLKADGKMGYVTGKYVKMLSALAKRIYEDTGIHIFGFAIDDNGGSSMAWGGTIQYAKLRERWKTSINSQLKDYETMFRTQRMEERGIVDAWSRGGPQPPQRQLLRRQGESARDYERRLFKESLLLDLARIMLARGENAPETMDWDLGDMGWKFQVRLVDWPGELSGEKHQPKPKFKLTSEAKAILIPLLKKKHGLDDSDDDAEEERGGEDEDEDEEKSEKVDEDQGEEKSDDDEKSKDAEEKRERYPRLESWTEKERVLSGSKLGAVSVLVTKSGTVLQQVSDGKKYQLSLVADQKKMEKQQEKKRQAETKKAQKKATTSTKTTAKRATESSTTNAGGSKAGKPWGKAQAGGDAAEDGASDNENNNVFVQDSDEEDDNAESRRPRPVAAFPRAPPSTKQGKPHPVAPFAGAPQSTKHGLFGLPVRANNQDEGKGKGRAVVGGADSGGASASSSKVTLESLRENEDERVAKRVKLSHGEPEGDKERIRPTPNTLKEEGAPNVHAPNRPTAGPERACPPTSEWNWMEHSSRFHDTFGELRSSAPAGTPVRPVLEGMSLADQLEYCWVGMPGALSSGEKRCRYAMPDGGKKSRHFYVARFQDRAADNPADEDEGAQCLQMCMTGQWKPVVMERVPVVVQRHVQYHRTLYEDFFTPAE